MGIVRYAAVCLIAFTASACSVAAAEEIDLAPATAVAEEWLARIDTGRYGQAWDSAAESFRDTSPKMAFEDAMQSARAPLGIVNARKVRSALYTKNPSGAGDYVVIQYDTRFENRPLSSETVTPMLQKDGTWRVAGYFIR